MLNELKYNCKSFMFGKLFDLSCKMKAPVFSWKWKSMVYEKRNRNKLWKAYQKDITI